jgi:hypothetical protein
MTDLLLTHGYFLADDEKERQIMKPYPPLGLLYLSAYLKRAGFSVEISTARFESAPSSRRALAATPGGRAGHLHQSHDAPFGARDRCARAAAWLDGDNSAVPRAPTTPRNTSMPAPTSS